MKVLLRLVPSHSIGRLQSEKESGSLIGLCLGPDHPPVGFL
jgi:hypothetical protein